MSSSLLVPIQSGCVWLIGNSYFTLILVKNVPTLNHLLLILIMPLKL